MPENYLLQHLKDYFEELLILQSKRNVTISFMTKFKDQLLTEDRKNRMLFSAIESYRDLSKLHPPENLYHPDFSYYVTLDNVDETVKELASQANCFMISQAYEVFESFLVSITAEYIYHNQDNKNIIKVTKQDTPLTKSEYRKWVKDQPGNNNKGVFGLVRKLSAHFREHENNNIHSIKIMEWFDMISVVRHTLVHNRQIISDNLLEYLKTDSVKELFDRSFQRKKIGKNICIWMESDRSTGVIQWLDSFAHFIFKCLSLEMNLNIAIPQYKP